jgi:hypothetical protein
MTTDGREGAIFGIKSEHAGATSAVAISLMRNITQVDRDNALEAAVAGLVLDARRSAPNSYPGGGAPGRDALPPLQRSGGGTRPIEPPQGVNIIDAMVNAMQPHGPGHPERLGLTRELRGADAEARLARAVADARATLEAALAAPEAVSAALDSAPVAETESAPAVLATVAEPVAEAVAAPKAGVLTRRRLA